MPRYERILIPTDGSSESHDLVAHGIDLAQAVGGRVTGFYVLDDTPFASLPGDISWNAVYEMLKEEGRKALADIEAAAGNAKVPCATKMAEGHPADEIIKECADHDLAVMGTHGRSGLDHLLMGSVAEKVTRHAPCPVLIIRLKKGERG